MFFFVDDLHFDVNLFSCVELAGHIEAGQFVIFILGCFLCLVKTDVGNGMAKRLLQYGVEKVNRDLLAFLFAKNKLKEDVVHRIVVVGIELPQKLFFSCQSKHPFLFSLYHSLGRKVSILSRGQTLHATLQT